MENTKTNIKSILWHYTTRIIKFFALNGYRAFLIILGYFFHIVSILAEVCLRITAFLAKDVQVYFTGILKDPERDNFLPKGQEQIAFEPAFSKTQIEQIASSINPDAKIKDIEEDLGVSYRQARKIQQAAKNTIPVNHYRLVDRPA